MTSTRDVIAPPIFAEDASTVIPPTPIAGVSYRDPVAGPASSPDGWPYAQLVNSAEWNQLMFQWSSLLSIMDLKGILGWSDLKDYTEQAITFASDGNIYTWIQESGPNTVAGVRDPISEPTYWQSLADYVGANDTINAPIATVAAAGTINLTAGAPNTSQIVISGTAAINGFTVAAGRAFFVKFSGDCTLVNGASLVTGTGGNIAVTAGSTCIIRATAANVVEVVGYVESSLIGTKVSGFAKTLLDDADASAARATLDVYSKAEANGIAIGVGQTWQDVTGSRAKGTTYTNSTGRPIQILVQYQDDASTAAATFKIGSLTRTTADMGGGATYAYWFSAVIPNGTTYSISGGVNLPAWWELR